MLKEKTQIFNWSKYKKCKNLRNYFVSVRGVRSCWIQGFFPSAAWGEKGGNNREIENHLQNKIKQHKK